MIKTGTILREKQFGLDFKFKYKSKPTTTFLLSDREKQKFDNNTHFYQKNIVITAEVLELRGTNGNELEL